MTKPLMLSNLTNVEFTEIQNIAKSETVDKIVKLLQEKRPDWNALLNECKGGYQLLLAAKLRGVEDDLIATGLIFLYHFQANQTVTVKYLNFLVHNGVVQHLDKPEDAIPDNQKCVLEVAWVDEKNDTNKYMVGSFGALKARYPTLFAYQPMIHPSNRRDMIQRLSQRISDILIPLPGIPLHIHGAKVCAQNYLSAFGIIHDFQHAEYRDKIIQKHGWEAYEAQLKLAKRFEDAKDTLPPYSVEFLSEEYGIFKSKNPAPTDLIKLLLDTASGELIDGFLDPKPIKDILDNALTSRKVNCRNFLLSLTEKEKDQVYDIESRQMYSTLTTDTLAYLNDK